MQELLGLLALPLERYVRTAVEEGVGRLLVRKKEGDVEEGQGSQNVLGRLKELAVHRENYVRASVAVVLKSVFVLERAEEAIRLKSQGDLKEASYIQEECDMVKALACDDDDKVRYAALDALSPVSSLPSPVAALHVASWPWRLTGRQWR